MELGWLSTFSCLLCSGHLFVISLLQADQNGNKGFTSTLPFCHHMLLACIWYFFFICHILLPHFILFLLLFSFFCLCQLSSFPVPLSFFFFKGERDGNGMNVENPNVKFDH